MAVGPLPSTCTSQNWLFTPLGVTSDQVLPESLLRTRPQSVATSTGRLPGVPAPIETLWALRALPPHALAAASVHVAPPSRLTYT